MTEPTELSLSTIAAGRRDLLRGSALALGGLAAAALVGCGGDDDDAEPSGGNEAPAGPALKTTDPRPAQLPAGWVWAADAPYPWDFPEPTGKTPKAGGIFNVAASWDVGPFDPVSAAAGGSIIVPNLVYNRLLGFNLGVGSPKDKVELRPELAQSWERSPDGLTVTFKLTPGVKWQNIAPLNGRDFVAADVKFAFERYQTTGVYKSYWSGVQSIEAVDSATLRIKLSRPLVDFITPLAGRYQTIFPHELVDDGSISKTVIGTSSLILREAVAGQRVRLEKNPNYWSTFYLDGMEFRPMPDAAARLAALRSGQVEYAYAPAGTKREIGEIVKTNPDMQVTAYVSSGASGAVPLFNHQNPKWQDIRVRRAVSLGIDRTAIANLVYEGFARPLSILPWLFVHNEVPTIESGKLGPWVKYDPAQAKQLLQAAGQDGLVVDARYYEYTTSTTQVAEIQADQLRQIGIQYKPTKLDYTEFNSQLIGGTFPDALAVSFLPLGFEADTYFYNGIHSKSPGNRDHMNDSDIDGWATAQQIELDPAARKQLHTKIWDKYHDQVYRPVTTTGTQYDLLQPWVRGLRFEGALGIGHDYYDWGQLVGSTWLDK